MVLAIGTPVLSVRSTKDFPEPPAPILPTKVMPKLSSLPAMTEVTVLELPTFPVVPNEAMPVSYVMPTYDVFASQVMPVTPKEVIPTCHVMSTEALPELAVPPVVATETDKEVMFKQPALPIMAIEAVPEQLASCTTQANPEQPVLSATAQVQEPPESAPVQEPPEPTQERAVPEPALEEVVSEPAAEEDVVFKPAPEREQFPSPIFRPCCRKANCFQSFLLFFETLKFNQSHRGAG